MAQLRHQDKDIQKVLERAEKHGWRVVQKKGYWSLRCSCPDKHIHTVVMTPSNPNYAQNLERWLMRQGCWANVEAQ